MLTSHRSTSAQRLWLKALLFALFGYAALGRTFAYLFVGELLLVVGLFLFLSNPRFTLLLSDKVLFLWTVFAVWGLCRTVPFLAQYKFLAVRDAVIWGYGVFAVLIVAFVNNSGQISRALNTYRKFLRWYVPLIPIILGIAQFLRASLPSLPWAPEISILAVKAPDAGVHLAAAGLFLLIFPDDRPRSIKAGPSLYRIVAFIGWSLCAVEIIVLSRGGFVAMMIPILLVSFLRFKAIGIKVVALGVMAVLLSVVVLESNLITTNVRGRALNADTVTNNLGSLVGGSGGGGGQQDNKAWRLVWWRKIIHYTFGGQYFLTGKGFGVNLATSDGPPGIPSTEAALRSPHNGTMTVLARTGVPGLLIWLSINFVFAFKLFRAYRRASRAGSQFWSGLNLWILCYWLSLIINSCFDVYLEGPQGGIWFWSVIGFGVAAMRIQAFEARQADVQRKLQESAAMEFQPDLVHA